MKKQIQISVGDVPWPVAVKANQSVCVIGFFAGGTMPYDLCVRHAGRYRAWNRGQLMSDRDARYEGLDDVHADLWCQKCMTAHAWPKHEYLIQGARYGFEVLDLSATLNGECGPVVFRGTYDQCERWTNGVKESQHYMVLI